jgi:hypothetical protein
MRITDRYKEGIPQVDVSSENGTTNIIHLLQPGYTIRRNRPRDAEGDQLYTIRKMPFLVNAGKPNESWRLGLVGENGGNLGIDLQDLIAPANSENGRSWRLEVPEALPADFEPATADKYPELAA